MLLFTGLLWPLSATAGDNSTLVVQTESADCSEDLAEDFVRELDLRTSAKIVSSNGADEDASYRLTLHSGADGSCEIRLGNSQDRWTLVIAGDANRPQIASTANRVAWILDGTYVPEPDPPAVEEPIEFTPTTDEGESVDEARHRNFSVDATGGALWIPAAQNTAPLARMRATWMPRQNLRFGLTGRLPMRPFVTARDDVTLSYRPLAFNLTAGYARQIDHRWSLRTDVGVQRTIPHLRATSASTSIDDSQSVDPESQRRSPQNRLDASEDWREDQDQQASDDVRHDDEVRDERPGLVSADSDSSTPQVLLSWAAVAHTSVRYAVTPDLALRLDAGIAVSPTHRRIEDEQAVLMDLGRLELDLLLGLDLRF